MARSCASSRLLPACAVLACLVVAPTQAAQSPGALVPPCNQPITLDAASGELDVATKTIVFTKVMINQCSLHLQADRARGNDPVSFANSQWTFAGHVHMDAEHRGSLRSDEAVVDFRDNRIAHATATGKPAEFEQRNESQQLAHGHADEIVYDVNEGTLRLLNNAYLSNGGNEIYGGQVVYNIRAQSVQAAKSPGSDQGVHLVITPDNTSTTPPAARPPDARPAPPSPP
jgi:lipopolysaccharide transport protein LptA